MTIADIIEARRRIAPHVRRTPLFASAWLSALADAEVRLKLESLQPTNSYKIRGATNASAAFIERHGGKPGPPGRIVPRPRGTTAARWRMPPSGSV